MSAWPPARRRSAGYALLAAVTTAAWLVLLQPGAAPRAGLWAYLAVVAVAVFYPAGITVQVLLGLALVGDLLLATEGPGGLLAVPAVAGVIATAELLAVVARLDAPIRSQAHHPHGAAARSAAVGAVVFAAVSLVSGLPGPGGLLAVLLAAGACAAVGGRLFAGEASS